MGRVPSGRLRCTPTLAKPNIPVLLGDAFIPYSYEVGMEAINFLQELQKVLIDGAQQLQNTASTTGVGTTEPKGVITAIVGTASVVNSAGADVFAKADVYNAQGPPGRPRGSQRW